MAVKNKQTLRDWPGGTKTDTMTGLVPLDRAWSEGFVLQVSSRSNLGLAGSVPLKKARFWYINLKFFRFLSVKFPQMNGTWNFLVLKYQWLLFFENINNSSNSVPVKNSRFWPKLGLSEAHVSGLLPAKPYMAANWKLCHAKDTHLNYNSTEFHISATSGSSAVSFSKKANFWPILDFFYRS